MKKLLSILAALGISATAMTSVVACGVNSKYPITQEPENNNNSNNSGGNNNQNPGWESKDNTDRENPDKPTPPPIKVENVYQNNQNIKTIFQQAVKRTIYQDQFGFNQKYLDEQLFNQISELIPETGSLTTTSSESDFINYYLNKIEGDVVLRGDKGSSTAEPFFDFLPSQGQAVMKTVLGVVKNADFISPTSLLSLLSGGVGLLGTINPLANLILNYKDQTLKITEPILNNPQIKAMVDHLGDNSWLDAYQDYTLIDSQKIIVNGLAWALGLGAGENDQVQQFGQTVGDVSQFNKATDYLVDLIGRLVNQKVTIDPQNYLKFIFTDPTNKIVNQDNLSLLINNAFLVISMLSAYLQAFGDYKVDHPTDANHIFAINQTNWEVISKVHNTKLRELAENGALKLNLWALVSNLDYYLGDLNNETGMYRLQALCAILFLDENGQKANKLTIDWNNSSKIIDYGKVTPLNYLLTQMITKVVDLDKVLPSTVKSLLKLFGYDINNETVSVAIYQLLESFSTQKSLEFSKAMYNKISKPGGWLAVAPYIDFNWFNRLFANPLDFLYFGNLVSWLNDFPDSIKGTSFASNIAAGTAKSELKEPIQNVTMGMKAIVGEDNFNIKTLAGFSLGKILTIANVGLFNQNSYRFPPTFASYYTNKNISQLVDELADLVDVNKMDNNAVLKAKGIDLNQLKEIVQTLWITNEAGEPSNIVKEFFTILENNSGNQRVTKINNLLGIVGTNRYDTSKILGKLLIFLTPGLDKPANRGTMKVGNQTINWINGDYRLGSPILSRLKNAFLKVWTDLNAQTNYDELLKAAWVIDNQTDQAFDGQEMTYKYKVNGDETSALLVVSQVITYQWTSPNRTVNSTTYNFVLSRTNVKTPFTLKVEKQVNDTHQTD